MTLDYSHQPHTTYLSNLTFAAVKYSCPSPGWFAPQCFISILWPRKGVNMQDRVVKIPSVKAIGFIEDIVGKVDDNSVPAQTLEVVNNSTATI